MEETKPTICRPVFAGRIGDGTLAQDWRPSSALGKRYNIGTGVDDAVDKVCQLSKRRFFFGPVVVPVVGAFNAPFDVTKACLGVIGRDFGFAH